MNHRIFAEEFAVRIGLGLYTTTEKLYGCLQAFGRPDPAIQHPALYTALFDDLSCGNDSCNITQ